ncbi:hypothetical protein BV20DRAFT_971618 [Pilatotrama ljubarskyi]|nr:hypothetical protein BV20DRAFT_971618 [Pilatotrama ljubarskyi]
MGGSDKHDEWRHDAQAADPVVLPEYTLLPPSPPAGPSPPRGPNPSSPGPSHQTGADSDPRPSPAAPSEARRIVRGIMRGLLAIVLPPVIIAGAVLAAALAMIYGSGKMLEGIGRTIAVGPEALYKACVGKRANAAWRAMRGKKARPVEVDAEVGAISI